VDTYAPKQGIKDNISKGTEHPPRRMHACLPLNCQITMPTSTDFWRAKYFTDAQKRGAPLELSNNAN